MTPQTNHTPELIEALRLIVDLNDAGGDEYVFDYTDARLETLIVARRAIAKATDTAYPLTG